MKFSCQSCAAKYSIPDERVENKVVRLQCQKCGQEIVVRGPSVPKPAPAPDPAFTTEEDEPEVRDTTRIANLSELETMRQRAASDAQQGKKKPTPPPPPEDTEPRHWMVLVQGEQRGPYTEAEVIDQLHNGTLHAKSYLWREGMKEWARAGNIDPFRVHAAVEPTPKVSKPPAVESGDATIPEFDLKAFDNQKKMPQRPIAELTETSPGTTSDDFDSLFGPRSVETTPPPLKLATRTDVHTIDEEGPTSLGDAPLTDEPVSQAKPRGETRMLMAQAGLDDRKRHQKMLVIGIVVIAVAIIGLLALFMGSSEDTQPVDTTRDTSKPASAPATVVTDEEKKRIREQLMGKPKEETQAPAPKAVGHDFVKEEDEAAEKTAEETTAKTPSPPPEPSGKVGLEQEQITSVVAANQRQIKNCYERELKRGDAPSGKLVLEFSIANTGEVATATVSQAPFRGTELAECVVTAAKTWKFPSFSGDRVNVEYPFLLSPNP